MPGIFPVRARIAAVKRTLYPQTSTSVQSLNRANRRMLIALAVVCVTFIVTIIVFVTGYTQREKNWLDTIGRLGVTNGVQQSVDH